MTPQATPSIALIDAAPFEAMRPRLFGIAYRTLQLVTRARVLLAGEPGRQASAAEQQRFIDAFVDAAQTGHLTTLEQLLAAQVGTTSPATIAA